MHLHVSDKRSGYGDFQRYLRRATDSKNKNGFSLNLLLDGRPHLRLGITRLSDLPTPHLKVSASGDFRWISFDRERLRILAANMLLIELVTKNWISWSSSTIRLSDHTLYYYAFPSHSTSALDDTSLYSNTVRAATIAEPACTGDFACPCPVGTFRPPSA